jgi:hypothetical protein
LILSLLGLLNITARVQEDLGEEWQRLKPSKQQIYLRRKSEYFYFL